MTNVDQLKVSYKVIIVNSDKTKALSTTQNNNNRGQAEIDFEADKDKANAGNDNIQIITLAIGNKNNTFAFSVGAGYLYAAGSNKNNYLKTETNLSDNSSWEITVTDAGIATITAQGTYTNNKMRYNSSSGLFSCYSSGQQDIRILVLA